MASTPGACSERERESSVSHVLGVKRHGTKGEENGDERMLDKGRANCLNRHEQPKHVWQVFQAHELDDEGSDEGNCRSCREPKQEAEDPHKPRQMGGEREEQDGAPGCEAAGLGRDRVSKGRMLCVRKEGEGTE